MEIYVVRRKQTFPYRGMEIIEETICEQWVHFFVSVVLSSSPAHAHCTLHTAHALSHTANKLVFRVCFMEQGCCKLIPRIESHMLQPFSRKMHGKQNDKNKRTKNREKKIIYRLRRPIRVLKKPFRLFYMTKQLTGSHKQIQSINMQSKSDDESFINNFVPHPVSYGGSHTYTQTYRLMELFYQYVQWKIQFSAISNCRFDPNKLT